MPAVHRQATVVDLEIGDGRRIRVRRRRGRGTPVVFLHGLLDSSEGWGEMSAATGRPSVAFDLPGFGGSDLPIRPRVSAYAEDVAAGIEKLGLGDFVLVGHSFGGAVAAVLAERLADRVVSLVLLAPAGFGRIALAEAVSIPGVREVAAATLPLWLNTPALLGTGYRLFVTAGEKVEADVVDRVRRDSDKLVPAAVVATRAVVAAGLSKRALHRRPVGYRGPVTALWGARDRVVPPRHADGVTRAFPQAEVTRWPGMGHHPQRERPAELSAFIEAACACERQAVPAAAPAVASASA